LKERLITLGLAIAALFLCYALFLPKPAAEASAPSRPLSTESGLAGYQAVWRWLEAEHLPVIALHDRFDRLSGGGQSLHRTGNILLTTLPYKVAMRSGEASDLDAWIERGNTLLVAAALDDTPGWAALENGARLFKDLGRLTRLNFETTDEEKDGKASRPKRALKSALSVLSEPRTIVIEPRGEHPLMEGVHTLRVISDLPASRWRATPMDSSGILEVARMTDGGAGAIWVKRQEKGQVITLAVAGLFSNRDIGAADNAALLANLIAWSLKPGGTVIFDDAHQGAVGYYDAKAFYADPRLHRTIGWLVLLWFIFVLGIQRLNPLPEDWRPADVTAFLGRSGEFLASSVAPATAGARLLANFFNSIRRRSGLPEDGAPTWEWLSSQAAVATGDVTELRELYDRIQAGRRFNLPRLQNLLIQLQGKTT
jgi:hypothetical protein